MTDFIKVRYNEGETGWAEDLGDGTVKIANCPFAGGLGLGDICSTYEGNDGWRTVDEVLIQRYPNSATFWYKELNHFYVMSGACCVKDWALEGGVGPKGGSEGFATVNYDGEETDLEALAKLLGIQGKTRITFHVKEEEEDPEFDDTELSISVEEETA
jgi:hypothetical protein